ncbi:MAG: mechanosensitive ion channel [Acidobacteriota bacterium]|jgi:small conductance mechanosensitive channel|nr:mechanosensitive ion channel [Acidobacteriota bacterium]
MSSLIERLDMIQLLTRVVEYLPKVFAALVVLVLFWLIYRMTRLPLSGLLERAGLHRTLVNLLVTNLYRATVLVFAVVMAADQIGVNVGAALAGLGVVGIAVGFAAQDSIANVFAGIMIFMDKPFEVGHWITVVDQYGEVNDITMRSTRIRTKRNTYVVIPNKTIIDEVLVNHSQKGVTRVDVPIGIAYKESILGARQVMLASVRGLDGVLTDPPPDVVVAELGDSSVNLNLRVWIERATDEEPVFFCVLEAAKLALDEAGIEIPFPHLQLFLENIEDRVWQKLAQHRPDAPHGDTPS